MTKLKAVSIGIYWGKNGNSFDVYTTETRNDKSIKRHVETFAVYQDARAYAETAQATYAMAVPLYDLVRLERVLWPERLPVAA